MKDRSGVIAPPPLIFVAFFVLGWLGRDFLPRFASMRAAMIIVFLAGTLMFWALWTMLRARTSPDPYTATTTVVTSGPFRFTRNPLYVSMNLFYVAASFATGSLTSLLLLPVAEVVLYFGVIRREELYLEAKFGDSYRDYRSRVRRWL